MKKILGLLISGLLLSSCSLNAKEWEIAIANRCEHDVTISTSEHIGKITLKPNEVLFQYSEDDYFALVTDIRYSGVYENGQGWSDVQRIYFYSNGHDRQLEILEDGFYLDEDFIEPMDWN